MKKLFILSCLMIFPLLSQANTSSELLHYSSYNPMFEYLRWDKTAKKYHIPAINVVILATASSENYPQQQLIQIKSVNEKGFIFSFDNNKATNDQPTNGKKANLILLWKKADLFLKITVTGKIETLKHSQKNSSNNYLLQPKSVRFTVTDKSNKTIRHDYLNYNYTAKQWLLKESHSTSPKTL